MKKIFIVCMIFGFQMTAMASDWRKGNDNQQKLDNVVKVVPGASTIMLQMGNRYRNLYWAGKKEKWDFAAYQLEEIEELIKVLMITRPKRAATAKHFLNNAVKNMPAAIEAKDWKLFNQAFQTMRIACLDCHVQNQHAYITLPEKPAMGTSLVLEAD